MKETEQTLFRKSNILHIRTNEGEFEVSNPGTLPNNVFPCGWSGDVELIDMYQLNEGHGWITFEQVSQAKSGTYIKKRFAWLIPEEKKKPVFIPEDHPFAATAQMSKMYDTKTESAYKEFEGKDSDSGDGLSTIGSNNRETKVESSEPQKKEHLLKDWKWAVSAPSESQEELWRDFQWRLLCDGKINVSIELLKDIGKHFTITRKPE